MSTTIHPLINLLVRNIESIDTCINEGNYTEACVVLQNVITKLRKTHRDEETLAELETFITQIENIQGYHYADTMGKKKLHERRLWKEHGKRLTQTVYDLLWDNNYLVQEGYGFNDLTEGKPRR